MPDKSGVCCWTSLIEGYARLGCSEEVLRLFYKMVEENVKPETDALVSVLSACSNLHVDQVEKWVALLSKLIDSIGSGDPVNYVLVYLYGKSGRMDKSRERFDCIMSDGKRNVLPWNSMINAYVQNGEPLEGLNLFRSMVDDTHCTPNHVTLVSVLSACAQIGDLDLGRWAHGYLKTRGFKGVLESNTFLATALIDMYCKCGSLDQAMDVFNKMVTKDVVSFNAMIMGLAVNGKGEDAVTLFGKMQDYSLHPNAGTFLGLLWACSHSGLSNKGRQIFHDMTSVFGIAPKLEHYACYIDILSREGHLEEAISIAASMAFKPNNFVWGALLGGCLLHTRLDLAQDVYKRLVEVDAGNSACYVMLANAFADDRRWHDVSALRWLMKEKGVKKQPGSSWVSIDGTIHEFLAGSTTHPEIANIYHTLHGLVNEMRFLTS
ncbi:Pentatricopeptide repeat-containing protein At2g29760, chloroplastic [Linum perenne]